MVSSGACSETCARHGQTEASAKLVAAQVATPEVVLPTPGLNLAMDPRIPDELEVFAFELQKDSDIRRVEWVLNDQPIGTSTTYAYEWPLARGSHRLRANVWLGEKQEAIATREVHFLVK